MVECGRGGCGRWCSLDGRAGGGGVGLRLLDLMRGLWILLGADRLCGRPLVVVGRCLRAVERVSDGAASFALGSEVLVVACLGTR